MRGRKIYAGTTLRDLRQRLSLTQKSFAAKLGVSLPYLTQMENNNRPVSSAVLLALAQEFGFDVTELSTGDSERLVSDMREALADPIFAETQPALADVRLAASNAPVLTRAFLELHRAYRQTQERLMSLDEALGRDDARLQPSPWEEVRDFFHYCDNYIDAVDRSAEIFAKDCDGPDWVRNAAEDQLEKHGVRLRYTDHPALRQFDTNSQTLSLSVHSSPQTQAFQMVLQLALITQNALSEGTLDLARFQTNEARAIAKIGLANYYAGAALMPYGLFLEAAQSERHDLERLATKFAVSVEQVAHRLST